VAVATLELLERQGCEVYYPDNQTCCGQPLANAGFESVGAPLVPHFASLFEGCEYVVGPSASCVLHVRERHVLAGNEDADVASRTMELCEFLTDVLNVSGIDVSFPHRVGLLVGCHGLRGLRLAPDSETGAGADKVRGLLRLVQGLELVDTERPDECCGFGGTFAVTEPAVSGAMGRDRLDDHVRSGADVLAGTDMSCLMHLEGLARRGNLPLRLVHVAEILNGSA